MKKLFALAIVVLMAAASAKELSDCFLVAGDNQIGETISFAPGTNSQQAELQAISFAPADSITSAQLANTASPTPKPFKPSKQFQDKDYLFFAAGFAVIGAFAYILNKHAKA